MLQSYLLKIKLTLQNQLRQGTSSKELAQSIAWGMILGIIPILGVTTGLCGLLGMRLKLNHVALQTVNYIAYPLQLMLLVPFFRLGEWIFQQPPVPLYVPDLIEKFKVDLWGSTKEYALTGAMGTVAWFLVAPVLYLIVYNLMKFLLRGLRGHLPPNPLG